MSNTPQSEETLDEILAVLLWDDAASAPIVSNSKRAMDAKLALTAYIDGIVSEVIGAPVIRDAPTAEAAYMDSAVNHRLESQRTRYQAIKQERGLV